MDEEFDPGDEDVNSVLAQESSELLHILSSQSPSVILELCQMMPSGAAGNIDCELMASTSSSATVTELIKAMLEYFSVANAADCCRFLQSMCLLCENIPMHLESRLMSVAGNANNLYRSSDVSGSSTLKEESASLHSEQQLVKRPRLDHWETYIAAVTRLLLRRWERLSETLVKEVHPENVWVNLRTANRVRDRPDQTPGQADRGSRTPEPDGDFVSSDSKVTLENFLQGCAGKVTVVVGQAGSGKTLLMSCLGQQWANGLGPIPSSYLFVLLEFRQLNLLSDPLSLSELLFRHYLAPQGDDEEKRAILDYLLSNPEQSCWVLDGYDEFYGKIPRQEVLGERLEPESPLPVANLISGLLNRQLLPGCTVLVTCRVRDVLDLEGISDKVGQLLGWDCSEIKEYVDNFFGVKGDSANRALRMKAVDLLLSSQHLLAMSYVPALCNICCICVKHLLMEEEEEGAKAQSREEDRARRTKREASENELTGEQNAKVKLGGGGDRAGINGRGLLAPTPAQLPSTLTQVYLTVLTAFLSSDSDRAKTVKPPQRLSTLTEYGPEICELSQLAWRGLEEGKILFMEEDISQNVLEFSIRTGLLSQVQLRLEDGLICSFYSFIHLTMQEFLAALRVMTSNDVSDVQLQKRLSLKTRWMTRSDQRTVFTDSLQLYVCGLASKHCTPALVQLAGASHQADSWVLKRQASVLKLLNRLCHSSNLTGPKMLELCLCLQETQDHQLAKEFMGTRATLELRNIRLLPKDIDALAFVMNSVGNQGIGLDFRACSMEPQCFDVLRRCQYIHHLRFQLLREQLHRGLGRICYFASYIWQLIGHLSCILRNCLETFSFRSRKYGDKFSEMLSSILPEFTALRKLEFCGASLTATGAASLASALEKCPHVTEINLSDNNLKDEGIKLIADIFTKLPQLVSVMVGLNNSSVEAVDYLIQKMASCFNIQHVVADAMKDVRVTFYQSSDLSSNKKSEPTVSLLNQNWDKSEMQRIAQSLTYCPALSVLNLSGGQWDVEILKTLTHFLPKINVTEKIILNDSCTEVEDLVVLTALLSNCPDVVELHIRLQSSPDPVQVSILFSRGKKNPTITKTLCLSCCGLSHTDLDKVLKSLGGSCDLTVLDLSSNCLRNKGVKKLLAALPRLSNIQKINLSNNGISMEGVAMLAGALCSHDNATVFHISDMGREQVVLTFRSNKSDDKELLKVFRINKSSLVPADISTLCRRLTPCRSPLELDLSHSSLKDKTISSLLRVLPKMSTLQRLNVSNCHITTAGALLLISCLTVSQRVTSVELRPQNEGVIHFDSVKAEQASCRLTHLDLNSDEVERLIEILQQGPQLSELDLSSNQLEDEGVKRLMDSLPNLHITNFVNLSNNSLTQLGLLDVANTLRSCNNVSRVEVSLGEEERCLIWFRQYGGGEQTLSVRECPLQSEHLVKLAEIVSSCPSLTNLELKNNFLQLEWIEDFVKALSGCSVRIEEFWMKAEKAIDVVCRCLEVNNNIQAIRVQHNTLCLSLIKPTGLTSFSLVDCALEGHQLSPLKTVIQKCPSLTKLEVSHSSLATEATQFLCSVLPSLPKLTSLSIQTVSKQPCPTVVEPLSQALLRSATVQHLNLSGHMISDTAAQSLTWIFPRLQSLNLSHCLWSVEGGLALIKALGQCVSLQGLSLESVNLDESGRVCLAQALRNIHSIGSLKLNKIAAMGPSATAGVLDLLTAMEGLTQIEEIELDSWRLSHKGGEQLTRLLPMWTKLRKIRLSDNLISDQSGDKILAALISCSHLEELYLGSNNLGDLTAARMTLVLPSLTQITVLDISQNPIGNEGSVSLSKAIMTMKNLTKIQLTSVGTSGTSALCPVAASLAHCPRIQDVGLGWNNCGDEVVMELARVLPLCQKLTRIDLESNCVSVFGVEALLKALKSCPALQLIRLWRNSVSSCDAQRLSLKDRRLNFSST